MASLLKLTVFPTAQGKQMLGHLLSPDHELTSDIVFKEVLANARHPFTFLQDFYGLEKVFFFTTWLMMQLIFYCEILKNDSWKGRLKNEWLRSSHQIKSLSLRYLPSGTHKEI